MVWWIVGMTVAAVLGYGVWTYNRLVGLSKRADAAWSDIDVQLKRQVGPGSSPGRDGQGICSSRVEHAGACRGGAGAGGAVRFDPRARHARAESLGGRRPALRGG